MPGQGNNLAGNIAGGALSLAGLGLGMYSRYGGAGGVGQMTPSLGGSTAAQSMSAAITPQFAAMY